jgi:hypothetical protein
MAPGSAAATTEKQKTHGSTAADKDPAARYSAEGEGPLAGYMAELLYDENSKKRIKGTPGYRVGAGSLIRMMLSNRRVMGEKATRNAR